MKIDNYTRFLLTIIALCLVCLSLKDLIQVPKVEAQSPTRVILVDDTQRPVAQGSVLHVQVER